MSTSAPSTSSYKFALDDAARKYCEDYLNETEESRSAALSALRQWSLANPELRVKPDESVLIAFLRCCKFDLDRAKSRLADYHAMRRDAPEWYAGRNPSRPEIRELVRMGAFVPLKKRHERRLVVVVRVAAHDPALHALDDVFKAGNMVLDAATRGDEEAQIFGVVAIFDLRGVTLGHARQLTPATIKRAVRSWRNYHCRPQKLEFVNAPAYVNVVLSVFKGLMSKKMRARVGVHYGGAEAVRGIIPREMTPKDYGGDDESLEELGKYWHGKLLQHSDWFSKDEL